MPVTPTMFESWKTFTRLRPAFGGLSASWRWLTTGRYTRTLEDEVERLRAENRALLNSPLGTAGFPPILPDTVGTNWQARVPPVRRRSWHQLAALREWETAAPKPVNAPPPPKGPFH